MDLRHEFAVPTDVEATWGHFQDIARLAECFPGATVTSVEGDTFTGTCKVKLGPIALVYGGSGTFVEKDDVAHRFVVEAKGKDKRGNGTAGATVTLAMAAATSGGTDVEVVTDLSVTGKPAQFGRGVMQDVSDKLLGQFVACLEQRLQGDAPAAAIPATPVTPAGPEDPAPTPPAGPVSDPVAPPEPAGPVGSLDEPTPPPAREAVPPPPLSPAAPASHPPARRDDALDLGATVLPILLRTYWKQAVLAAVLIGLLVWLLVG
ncbi:SRPBCC family protein [Nocardioides sp. SYSU D00038]|uniref:SRPBCC family protein n=1 Tax=Nocardioides sp. SYSU D00038 TaxID=2812554 RepID=UPI0019676582|nr:SRPBCC domain-containing protein [Nocardioides sp. SYSU D00038]